MSISFLVSARSISFLFPFFSFSAAIFCSACLHRWLECWMVVWSRRTLAKNIMSSMDDKTNSCDSLLCDTMDGVASSKWKCLLDLVTNVTIEFSNSWICL